MTTISTKPNVVTRADYIPGPTQGCWTSAHYATLPEDGCRYEIIEGVLFMAPSPTGSHQDASLRLAHYLLMLVEFAGKGKVRIAPFDVLLDEHTLVQPDILVVLSEHLERLQPGRLLGAPDLVVEVASPATAIYDRREKCAAYARADVPEYWIADAASQTVEVLVLQEGTYRSLGFFEGQNALHSLIVPEIASVPTEQFFA